jgi:hypothetical protein
MKKFTILIFAFLLWLSGFAYTWNPIGTVQMNASKICFGVTFSDFVICADDGFYLYNISTHETTFYTYGLPVTGAAYLDTERILVTMGDGSWSDGIWTFDLQTHQFEVVEWVVYPNFLYRDDLTGTYWVGSQWGGLYKSQDGLIWEEDINFLAKPCGTMTGYGEHLVVTAIANLSNIYWSNDSGETWNASELFTYISDMSFSPNGLIYGVFPDNSNSSGLWKSEDFGNTWQIEFYANNMRAVGFDCFGIPFLGWKENLGIASYDPTTPPPGLTWRNEGLPNLNINKIQINPTMSAPALFVCTEAGVYFSQDYWLGIDENQQNPISVSPNPATENLTIKSEIPMSSLKLSCISGKQILSMKINTNQQQLDVSHLEAGIYLLEIEAEGRFFVKKLMVE